MQNILRDKKNGETYYTHMGNTTVFVNKKINLNIIDHL